MTINLVVLEWCNLSSLLRKISVSSFYSIYFCIPFTFIFFSKNKISVTLAHLTYFYCPQFYLFLSQIR